MRYLMPLLLLLTFGGDLSARQAPDLTAEEAVRLGLEHNRGLQAARADARGARAAFQQVRADRFPSLRVRGDYRRLMGDIPESEFTFPGIDTTFTLLPIPRDQVQTEVSLEQPLFQGFRLRNRARAAEHEAEAAGFMVSQEEADVALAVRRAYWELYRALANRESAEAALERIEAHLRDVESLFEEGVVMRTDLLAARTRRSEVALDRVEVDNAVRVARLELARLIGLPLDAEVEPVTPVPTATPVRAAGVDAPAELADLTAQALESRPELLALGQQVRALERQVEVTQGAWLPEVSLVGRFVYGRPNPLVFAEMEEFRGVGEAGILMRWSVFEGGRRPAQTAEARARLDRAEVRLAEARQEVAVRVARHSLEVARAEQALAVAAEHAEEAEESFRVVREQFTEGVVLSAQVLEAAQVHRAAEGREAAAIAQHAIAHAALLNALGQVW